MSLSKHFKISLGILCIAATVLIGGYEYVLHRIDGKNPVFEHRAVPVLPPQDKERISFNEKNHTLTIQTQKGITKEYAKSPVITVSKTGDVVVTRHLTGFENEWFIGFGYSDTGRIFLGDNLFHFSRFDIVTAISWTPDNRVIAFKTYIGLGYNFYHDTSINLAVNPAVVVTRTPDIAGFVSVRF